MKNFDEFVEPIGLHGLALILLVLVIASLPWVGLGIAIGWWIWG